MIQIIDGLLSTIELNFLKKECKSFKEELFQIYSVENKKHLVNTSLSNYMLKVNQYIKNIDADFFLDDMWINKISENSNLNEKFHYDDCDFSIVTYINNEYDGGQLEWIDSDGKLQTIIPFENLSILIPKKIYHRVTPVTKGNRYSLALFFKLKLKDRKKIL